MISLKIAASGSTRSPWVAWLIIVYLSMNEFKLKNYLATSFIIAAAFSATIPWIADSIGLIPAVDFRSVTIAAASALALLVCLVGSALLAGVTRKRARKTRSIALLAFIVVAILYLLLPSFAGSDDAREPGLQALRVVSFVLYWMLFSTIALIIVSSWVVFEKDT